MKCIFCEKDEKDVKLMLRKNNVGMCDECVLQFAQELNEYIKKETKDIFNDINLRKSRKDR